MWNEDSLEIPATIKSCASCLKQNCFGNILFDNVSARMYVCTNVYKNRKWKCKNAFKISEQWFKPQMNVPKLLWNAKNN